MNSSFVKTKISRKMKDIVLNVKSAYNLDLSGIVHGRGSYRKDKFTKRCNYEYLKQVRSVLNKMLEIHCLFRVTFCLLLPNFFSFLVTFCTVLFNFCLLCSLVSVCCSLIFTRCSLISARCLFLSDRCSLLFGRC